MNSKPATCLLCLKDNYSDKSLILLDLFTQEWGDATYINKLQGVLNTDITVYEETLICSVCLEELNRAYEFKEKVLRALDYWNATFQETVTFQEKIIEENVIDINDNNKINESNAPTEDILDTNVPNLEYKDEDVETEANVEANVDNDAENVNNFVENVDNVVEDVDNVLDNVVENKVENIVADVECIVKELEPGSPFPCSKCKVEFPTASELVNHSCVEEITSEPEKELEKIPRKRKKQKSSSYKCNMCDQHFCKVWKLNKHFEIHMGDKKFVCSYCNHAFKQSYHLKEHLTTHTGERNFSCNVCGKKFQRISSQKRHMRTHEAAPGEKSKKTPFLCNICGKSFPYSNGAQRHMRIHTGDKRYTCDTCGKKFNQSTHLKVHLRTHTGERPYMCNICGDAFSLKASLQKHMNGHSDTKNEDVKIFQNLEPNLSQAHCKSDDDDNKSYTVDDIQMYDQGFLITCSQ